MAYYSHSEGHDPRNVEKFNCTCLTEEQYACVNERKTSILSRSCFEIVDPGEGKKLLWCDGNAIASGGCYEIHFHIPKSCDPTYCKALIGLRIWFMAAILGIIAGAAAIVPLSILGLAAKRKITVHIICWTNFMALIPPAIIAYSLITTDVTKIYAQLGLNIWAWVMVIGFGIPLYAAWIYSFVTCRRVEYFDAEE